jgi:hypothetical protein
MVVYNVEGQVAAIPVDQFMEKGTHLITFDAQNLPSDIYCYRVNAGEFSQTKKMMLLK